MSFSESEVVALMGVAVALNAVGLVAWRRGFLGRWYAYALGLSVLALLVDSNNLPGVSSSGAIAAMSLGLVGLAAWVRHRNDLPADAPSR